MGESSGALLSADGRWLVFQSTAGNLVTNSSNRGILDIYFQDLHSGQVTLVSVNTNGTSGNARSYAPSLSADGHLVAFASEATDLTQGTTNILSRIDARDMKDGTTRLVSGGPNNAGANGLSTSPLVTPDGRYLFFESDASDLVPGDTNLNTDVFRVDLSSHETILVSDTGTNRLYHSWLPLPSDDGSRFVFRADSRSLSLSTVASSLIVRDLVTGSNVWINSLSPSFSSLSPSPVPAASADGRTVAFVILTNRLNGTVTTNAALYRVTLPNGSIEQIAPDLNTGFRMNRGAWAQLAISDDGLMVTFEAIDPLLPFGPEAVYQWNAPSGQLRIGVHQYRECRWTGRTPAVRTTARGQ
jgi:hypothetical protein